MTLLTKSRIAAAAALVAMVTGVAVASASPAAAAVSATQSTSASTTATTTQASHNSATQMPLSGRLHVPGLSIEPVPFPVPARLYQERYDTYFGDYRTVAAYQQFPLDLAEKYPELVEAVDFGDSWLKTQGRGGYDLLAVRITADVADQPAYTEADEHRPRFVVSAQMHAREIVTSDLAWRYATELVDGYGVDPQITALLDSTEVWVVFQFNPDGAAMVETALADSLTPLDVAGNATPEMGSDANQRKNANDSLFEPLNPNFPADDPMNLYRAPGIDLNRNFPSFWSNEHAEDPADETFPGPTAASEPETQAKMALLTQLFGEHPLAATDPPPTDRAGTFVNLHSCLGMVAYPYSYADDVEAPGAAAMKASVFRQTASNGYRAGSTGQVIYESAGTETDWIFSQLGVPAYTWEVGDCPPGGFFPAYDRMKYLYASVAPGLQFAAAATSAPYSSSLGGLVDSVNVQRQYDGSVLVTGVASDEHFGAGDDKTAAPAITLITAVEAALATDSEHIDETVELDIGAPATTVEFTGTLPSTDRDPASSVFVRAKNGSGEWGPWFTPTAETIAAPNYTGEREFSVVVGEKQELVLEASAQASTTVEIVDGRLPSGLSLDPDGTITGTARKTGASDVTIRVSTPAGQATDVKLTFTVSEEGQPPAGSAQATFPVPVIWAIGTAVVLAILTWILVRRARRRHARR